MAHSAITDVLILQDRLARYGGNGRVFEIQFTSIFRFGRNAMSHAFCEKKVSEALFHFKLI
jgi:hypothetical protein